MEHFWRSLSEKIDAISWESLRWRKASLIAANVLLGALFVVLPLRGWLPLDPVHFSFFAFIGFLFALYRPNWVFLLLIGFLPFETANLAPETFGFDLRPYQFTGFLLALALFVRVLSGKMRWSFFRIDWWDGLAIGVGAGAFLSIPGALDPALALRMAVIVFSFGVLYFLIRQFLRTPRDLAHIEPFILSSAAVVFFFALWQNVRFKFGQEAYMVMAGRPNGSFTEADWLGMYAAFIALFILGRILSRVLENGGGKAFWLSRIPVLVLLFLAWDVLITSVSRSAWLAAVSGLFVLYAWALVSVLKKNCSWKDYSLYFASIKLSLGLALLLVVLSDLTSFDLFSRAGSTATGTQTITVSCPAATALPAKIETVDELGPYGCRHINLEEIKGEQAAGHIVSELERSDPNIDIRANIYQKTWQVIKEHWSFGIGWGNIADILGTDERGAGLNSSNMFLEVWLGSGLLGFLCFILLWGGIGGFLSFRAWQGVAAEPGLLSLWAALSVFNLFNAGLLLAFFFFFLAWGVESLRWSRKADDKAVRA